MLVLPIGRIGHQNHQRHPNQNALPGIASQIVKIVVICTTRSFGKMSGPVMVLRIAQKVNIGFVSKNQGFLTQTIGMCVGQNGSRLLVVSDLLVSSIAHSILEESPLLWAQLILHIAHHGNLFVNLAFTCIYVRMKALLQVVIRPRRWIVGVFSFFGITRLLKTKEERRVESKRREKGKMNVLKVGCQMAALDIRSFLIAAIPYLAWLT